MSEDLQGIEEMAIEWGRPDLVWTPEQNAVGVPAAPGGVAGISPPDLLSGYPNIISLAEWTEREPMPDELVEGILHRGLKMMLGGGSKSFKTWVLMDLAIAVAGGGNWLGFPCHRGRVLYMNFELHPAFCQSRLRQIARRRGMQFEDLPNLDVWNLRGSATSAATFLESITQQLSVRDYKMFVIDPIYKLLGNMVENSAEDVAAVLNAIERLAVRCNAAVAFGHHFSKGNQAGKESIDRVSGSGVWARDPDSLIMLTRHEEEDSYTVDLTLRNHPSVDPFVVQWDYPVMVRRDDLNAHRLRRPGRGRQYSPDQVLEVLQTNGAAMRTSEWQRACQQQLGMSSSTFYDLRRELVDDSLVIESVNGYLPVTPLAECGETAASTPETPETSF
ncbi:MAG: AAA family ATPase [Luteolibacter sp.]